MSYIETTKVINLYQLSVELGSPLSAFGPYEDGHWEITSTAAQPWLELKVSEHVANPEFTPPAEPAPEPAPIFVPKTDGTEGGFWLYADKAGPGDQDYQVILAPATET